MKICRGNRPMYAAYTRIFMNHGHGKKEGTADVEL